MANGDFQSLKNKKGYIYNWFNDRLHYDNNLEGHIEFTLEMMTYQLSHINLTELLFRC